MPSFALSLFVSPERRTATAIFDIQRRSPSIFFDLDQGAGSARTGTLLDAPDSGVMPIGCKCNQSASRGTVSL
jgi:hypothetical protein